MEYRTLIYDALMRNIPGGKTTPSRWTTFNGPCCVHNGQMRPDTKKRSGILFDGDGRTSISCFNCGFRTGWSPGGVFSRKLETYFKWLGMPAEKLMRLNFSVSELRKDMMNNGTINMEALDQNPLAQLTFKPVDLPRGSMPISMWLEEGCDDPNFLQAITYLAGRGDDIMLSGDFYWTPNKEDQMNKRIIIPFEWEGEIVGYTGRLTTDEAGRRYMSSTQPHFIFDAHKIQPSWQYVIVNEGPMDARAVQGVAMLGDKVTAEQASWLNRSGKTIIVVPDRTNQGGKLVDTALAEGWHVSFPNWDEGIKDAADAVLAYGRLYAIWSIIDARTKNRLEIGVKRQRLR